MLSLNILLRKLFQWFRRPPLWATGDWQLHHNNAPAHASHLAQFFGDTSNCPGDSAPYSPDLVPRDFWLFPKLKSPLKRKRFQTVNEIQENATGQLMVTGRTVWGPKMPTLKETGASLSYVQCYLHLYLFNKCLYFSYYTIGYFLDRPHIYSRGFPKAMWICLYTG